MSELSKIKYLKFIRKLIDEGVVDPDELFKRTTQYYFSNDPDGDWFWDCQDDMEEIFDAFGSLLAHNYKGQLPGSADETADAKRFRKVRNWVESVTYDSQLNRLVKASTQTNLTGKFDNRMDAVMHFFAGAQVATHIGETASDVTSFLVECSDAAKSVYNNLMNGQRTMGYDSVDLSWGVRGSELENSFDVSESNGRNLAKKFATGTFKLSSWKQWFKKSGRILYSK